MATRCSSANCWQNSRSPLLILGVLLFGVPIGANILVLFLVRRLSGAPVAEPEAENRRLRERLDGERGWGKPGAAPECGGM